MTRARPIDREGILQKHGKLFVRDAVVTPHKFMAFDRSKAAGQFTHMREKAKGAVKGTPDTVLLPAGLPDIWCEWKFPPNKPDDDQAQIGADLIALGRIWFWSDSIPKYGQELLDYGVELRPNWQFLAMHHQAAAETTIAKAEAKRGTAPKSYKPRAVKASAGAVRRVSKLRSSVMF